RRREIIMTFKHVFAAAALATVTAVSAPRIAGAQTPLTLDVDATQAPMKILHASVAMPARAGAMTLFYAKWIPGEHMPSGPIWNLTGLHVSADEAEIEWRRDLVEMNALHLTVPDGARQLRA